MIQFLEVGTDNKMLSIIGISCCMINMPLLQSCYFIPCILFILISPLNRIHFSKYFPETWKDY